MDSQRYDKQLTNDSRFRDLTDDRQPSRPDESLWEIFRQRPETELNTPYDKNKKSKDSGDLSR
ncbi:MAG TPA: hypothetical protein VLQ45_17415 [Thermoanaerobaculia bacterium]|nr:hypothetical protein [Thermoanaerobaculia bacterium]